MCNECQNAIKGMAKRKSKKSKVNTNLLLGIAAGGLGGMLVEKVTEKIPQVQENKNIVPLIKGAAGAYLAIKTKSDLTKGLGYGLITISAMELAENAGMYGLQHPRRGMNPRARHNRHAGVLGYQKNGMYMGKRPVQGNIFV